MLDLRTDEQLMTAAREGDTAAFDTLAVRLRDVLRRFLTHLGCDEQSALELTQDALIRLWVSRDGYEPRARLRTLALTIARNLWLNHCRDRKREVCVGLQDDDSLLEPLPESRLPPGPEAELLREYAAYRLRRAIVQLPEKQRIVFVLAHLEGLQYEEIGRMLGVATGTVKSRMHRAVGNLRDSLAPDYQESPDKEE